MWLTFTAFAASFANFFTAFFDCCSAVSASEFPALFSTTILIEIIQCNFDFNFIFVMDSAHVCILLNLKPSIKSSSGSSSELSVLATNPQNQSGQ